VTSGDEVQPTDPDEDELAGWLGTLLWRTPPPPRDVLHEASRLFALRGVDAEYAALTADSDADGSLPHAPDAERAGISAAAAVATPVRHAQPRGRRRLSFEAPSISVIVEVSVAGRGLRLEGSVAPEGPGRVELRRAGAQPSVLVETDPRGGFVIDGVAPGPARLVCHRGEGSPVALQWVIL
jgi:hypothetical protein